MHLAAPVSLQKLHLKFALLALKCAFHISYVLHASAQKIAYMSQRFQMLENQVNVSSLRYEEAVRQDRLASVTRQGEDDKIKQALARFKETTAAYEAENRELKHRLESAIAEHMQLRLAVKDAEQTATDKKVERSVLQLRDALSTEMARTREEQNAMGELLMTKDLEIKELLEFKKSAQEKLEQFEHGDNDSKSQIMTLEVHNKSLMAQLEALQVQLAGAAELETLTNDIRQTVSGGRTMSEELVAEKERNLNLELEVKDLQHKMSVMAASMQGIRDVQGLSDDIRELVGGVGGSTAELLAEKEMRMAIEVENATLRREVEMLREQAQEQEKLEIVLGEINNWGHTVDGTRSLTSDLLVEKEHCSQLQVEWHMWRGEWECECHRCRLVGGEIRVHRVLAIHC